MNLADRIITRITQDPGAGCWLWEGAVSRFGHGVIRHRTKNILAHRAAYQEFVGPIPHGLLVCHKCDVPGCVRPDHLFLGTKADNSADMVAKNRSNKGEARPTAKLTAAQAVSIFLMAGSQQSIAKKFGVGQMAVSCIKRRVTWAAVTKHLVAA